MPPSSGISSAPPPSADASPGCHPAATHAAATEGQLLIRPTVTGGCAIALLLAAGIVAVNAGNNVLYLLVAALLAVFALSGILGHRNLRGVGLRLVPPEEIWAGRPASVRAELVNRRRVTPAFLLTVAGGAGAPAGTAVEIPPGSRAEIPLTLTFATRGVRPWPRHSVTSEFPFGLFRRGGLVQPPGDCLVYPAPLAVPGELAEGTEREGGRRNRRSPSLSGDHRGLRDYAPGDSISRVQWKSWLKMRRLHTKEFESAGAPPVSYRFESMPGPGTEERLGQLAWLVRTGLQRGRNVGLILPGLVIPPGGGPVHRRRLLTALARFGEPG